MEKTKRLRFPIEVILVCILWYVAYPLNYRHIEEMMEERSVVVDHSSIHRWSIRFLPILEKVFRQHKRPVGTSWRMDETYIKTWFRKFALSCRHRRLFLGTNPFWSGSKAGCRNEQAFHDLSSELPVICLKWVPSMQVWVAVYQYYVLPSKVIWNLVGGIRIIFINLCGCFLYPHHQRSIAFLDFFRDNAGQ